MDDMTTVEAAKFLIEHWDAFSTSHSDVRSWGLLGYVLRSRPVHPSRETRDRMVALLGGCVEDDVVDIFLTPEGGMGVQMECDGVIADIVLHDDGRSHVVVFPREQLIMGTPSKEMTFDAGDDARTLTFVSQYWAPSW